MYRARKCLTGEGAYNIIYEDANCWQGCFALLACLCTKLEIKEGHGWLVYMRRKGGWMTVTKPTVNNCQEKGNSAFTRGHPWYCCTMSL